MRDPGVYEGLHVVGHVNEGICHHVEQGHGWEHCGSREQTACVNQGCEGCKHHHQRTLHTKVCSDMRRQGREKDQPKASDQPAGQGHWSIVAEASGQHMSIVEELWQPSVPAGPDQGSIGCRTTTIEGACKQPAGVRQSGGNAMPTQSAAGGDMLCSIAAPPVVAVLYILAQQAYSSRRTAVYVLLRHDNPP